MSGSKTYTEAQNKIIFSSLLAHRDALEVHENFKRFEQVMSVRQYVEEFCPEEKKAEALASKHCKITACNQQRYWYNRYEYHMTLAMIEEHFKGGHFFDEKKMNEHYVEAEKCMAKFNALDRAAQAEDDRRVARCEALEAERIESYYR